MTKLGYFEARQVGDRMVYLSGNTTLPAEYVYVMVSAGGTAITTPTITFQNVTRMAGRKVTVHCIDIDNATTDRVIVDYSDGLSSGSTTGLNTTDVVVQFESTGREWVLTRTTV